MIFLFDILAGRHLRKHKYFSLVELFEEMLFFYQGGEGEGDRYGGQAEHEGDGEADHRLDRRHIRCKHLALEEGRNENR
jgi:hypothetical protein